MQDFYRLQIMDNNNEEIWPPLQELERYLLKFQHESSAAQPQSFVSASRFRTGFVHALSDIECLVQVPLVRVHSYKWKVMYREGAQWTIA